MVPFVRLQTLGESDVVFRNGAGNYVGGFICKIPYVTNHTVEVLAALEGLELAAQKNWQCIILESDALLVVQAIGSLHNLGSLMLYWLFKPWAACTVVRLPMSC
ncbi:hypothetical protein D8674_031436 [Pyrus ussuriensis x Pyrus communis]|uniref:RNase H type-1 domain-containing protein n=1 Tax=Pyrus ussuriensis x Pyrus communis TaxID=2448454 RepID=A0A5N5EYX1_9ROSA|nr:hypothetical protein D8674_031436 [Pyrus ussuriensis x Pyrus communis]